MKDCICSSSQKNVAVLGNKRGFADTIDGFSQEKFASNTTISAMFSPRSSGVQPTVTKEMPKVLQEQPCAANGTGLNSHTGPSASASAPTSKAQVVGWPPIRSFRRNSMATASKNNDEVDGKPGLAALLCEELSSALEKMFTCFTLAPRAMEKFKSMC
ncbi:hypothetical protein AHAS_Ahas06G0130800 [Arachis hypogaea]